MRPAPADPGTFFWSWSPTTPPAWRVGDEIRAPDTLVDTTFCATADAGSIPAVSTFVKHSNRPASVNWPDVLHVLDRDPGYPEPVGRRQARSRTSFATGESPGITRSAMAASAS